jgi:hypothetical protein
MSDYDDLCIRILSALTGLLPPTSWHVPERNEQRIAIAVCEAMGMTPERWDRLSKDERMPWLDKTLKVLERQPPPNAWFEGDDLPVYLPEFADDSTSVGLEALAETPTGRIDAETSETPSDESFDAEEAAILKVLLDSGNVKMIVSMIVSKLTLSDKTVRNKLKSLQDRNLVEYPNAKKGCRLTENGRAEAKRLPASAGNEFFRPRDTGR